MAIGLCLSQEGGDSVETRRIRQIFSRIWPKSSKSKENSSRSRWICRDLAKSTQNLIEILPNLVRSDLIELHTVENDGFWLVEISRVGWSHILKQRLDRFPPTNQAKTDSSKLVFRGRNPPPTVTSLGLGSFRVGLVGLGKWV